LGLWRWPPAPVDNHARASESSVDPIPVLLIDMARMLRDLITGLLTADGSVAVVGELPEGTPLLAAVDESGARVVIFGTGSSYPETDLDALLAARPRTRLLCVADDGRETTMYALRPSKRGLGDISAANLIEAVTTDPWPGAP
jgi:DNA-binding NarL/FixJ family response regulator